MIDAVISSTIAPLLPFAWNALALVLIRSSHRLQLGTGCQLPPF
jgi:hypothetical protein